MHIQPCRKDQENIELTKNHIDNNMIATWKKYTKTKSSTAI